MHMVPDMKTIRIERHMHDVYLYIYNRLNAGADVDLITNEVLSKFAVQWTYPVKPDILYDFVHSHVTQAFFYLNEYMHGYDEDKLK